MSIEERRDVKLLIAIPSGDQWEADFGVSLAAAVFAFGNFEVIPNVGTQSLDVYNLRSSLLCQSRESILQKGLEENFTHILWLDDDMVFPRNTIHRLFKHGKTFVGTNCVRKTIPARPTSVGLDKKELYTDPSDEHLQEVLHTGLAVALLSLEDLKGMKRPFFTMEWNEELGVFNGEDVTFCRKLREAGIPLYVDHALSQEIQHVGAFKYGHEHVGVLMNSEKEENYNG